MFLVVLDYVAELSVIDAALSAHGEWLDRHYREGLFLASGRREPRVGGVILARGPRESVEAAVATDPFAVQKLARHTVVEFRPSRFGGALDDPLIRAALA